MKIGKLKKMVGIKEHKAGTIIEIGWIWIKIKKISKYIILK
jgi:hypothetical protein